MALLHDWTLQLAAPSSTWSYKSAYITYTGRLVVGKSNQRVATLPSTFTQGATCELPSHLPTNLDVASACDADVPAAASMIAITPQP